jgi:hypothetical protein
LFNIYDNFKKFIHEFNVLEQVQDFKPMRKPYDKSNGVFVELLKRMKDNKNPILAKCFPYKRKMVVRDWLFYFYWCQKCKSTLFNRVMNPLKIEFSRFYGICFNQWDDFSPDELKKKSENKDEEKNDNLNPDNVVLFAIGDILIKGMNLNIHSSINLSNKDYKEYISFNATGIEVKINLSQNQFDLNSSIKSITIFPNNVIVGDKLIINTNYKKREQITDTMPSNEQNRIATMYDIDENTGLVGLVKKYNPNYDQKIKMIDNALDKIIPKSKMGSRAPSEADFSEFENNFKFKNKNNYNDDTSSNFIKFKNNNYYNNQKSPFKLVSNTNSKFNFTQIPKNFSFAKQIISNYEGTPTIQKMELKKQKNEFSISQAINEYNRRKTHERATLKSGKNPSNKIIGVIHSKNTSHSQIVSTGKNVPLNLLEISSNNTKSFIYKYTKNNNNKLIDHLLIQFGVIRFNLFADYICTYLNILNNYKSVFKQPIIEAMENLDNGIKLQKELFKLKRYIHNYILKMPAKKKGQNQQINEYLEYLKKELDKAIKLGAETDNFEINYLMSFFPSGFDFNFDYENLEFIYYSNDKKVCGKAVVPPSESHLKIDNNNFIIKFFDFELDINDLENAKFFIGKIMKILGEKLQMTKFFIEPCLAQLREDLKKKSKEKKADNIISQKATKKAKLENMLSLVQETFNNKRENKEIKQVDDDIVNYQNVFDIRDYSNNKDLIKINKEYKEQRAYVATLRENEEDEINDLDNDDLNLVDKIKVKHIQKPNNFFQNVIDTKKKNYDMDFDINSIDKYNQMETLTYQNSQNKNSKKNNLPKVNK